MRSGAVQLEQPEVLRGASQCGNDSLVRRTVLQISSESIQAAAVSAAAEQPLVECLHLVGVRFRARQDVGGDGVTRTAIGQNLGPGRVRMGLSAAAEHRRTLFAESPHLSNRRAG